MSRAYFVLAWLPLVLVALSFVLSGTAAGGPCPSPDGGGC